MGKGNDKNGESGGFNGNLPALGHLGEVDPGSHCCLRRLEDGRQCTSHSEGGGKRYDW